MGFYQASPLRNEKSKSGSALKNINRQESPILHMKNNKMDDKVNNTYHNEYRSQYYKHSADFNHKPYLDNQNSFNNTNQNFNTLNQSPNTRY